MTDNILLDVQKLSIKSGENILVKNISFHICKEEMFCLVGESGSGKSITSRTIMGLLDKRKIKVDGAITLDKQKNNLTMLSEKEWQKIRGEEIALIYQHPTLALHPFLKIGNQMLDVLRSKKSIGKKEAKKEVFQQLLEMNFSDPERIAAAYPSQLSGGMNQRVMISMALLLRPRLLIADEPTTGLDTINQQKVIRKLLELKEKYKMSILFITHDLHLADQIADKVAVMKNGEIIEVAPLSTIRENPQHSYTRDLWNTLPNSQGSEGGSKCF
ncbi:ABC transporter ATP-binding protein [Bacillus cereus]|nr:ABC transporter ATP-binding protein [Bacillus cereus]RHW05587.1 ABC transporter ATP-binding protein [Bacillus cereus]